MRPTLMRDSFYPLGDDISIFFRPAAPSLRKGRQKKRPGAAQSLLGLLLSLRSSSDLRKRKSEII